MRPKRTPAAAPAAPAAPAPSWLTARADSGGVPALLQRLAATVPAETMDEVWIFPTRRMPGFERAHSTRHTAHPAPVRPHAVDLTAAIHHLGIGR